LKYVLTFAHIPFVAPVSQAEICQSLSFSALTAPTTAHDESQLTNTTVILPITATGSDRRVDYGEGYYWNIELHWRVRLHRSQFMKVAVRTNSAEHRLDKGLLPVVLLDNARQISVGVTATTLGLVEGH
jgi:hypothetical protein